MRCLNFEMITCSRLFTIKEKENGDVRRWTQMCLALRVERGTAQSDTIQLYIWGYILLTLRLFVSLHRYLVEVPAVLLTAWHEIFVVVVPSVDRSQPCVWVGMIVWDWEKWNAGTRKRALSDLDRWLICEVWCDFDDHQFYLKGEVWH